MLLALLQDILKQDNRTPEQKAFEKKILENREALARPVKLLKRQLQLIEWSKKFRQLDEERAERMAKLFAKEREQAAEIVEAAFQAYLLILEKEQIYYGMAFDDMTPAEKQPDLLLANPEWLANYQQSVEKRKQREKEDKLKHEQAIDPDWHPDKNSRLSSMDSLDILDLMG